MIAQIDDSAEIFTLINTFHTSRDRQAAIVDSLRRFTEDVARSLPGFVAASVHASLDGARVVNYVQWRSAADLQAMLATAGKPRRTWRRSARWRTVSIPCRIAWPMSGRRLCPSRPER